MNTSGLAEVLRPLPRQHRIRVASQLHRLQRICDSDQPREQFSYQLLATLQRLMGASTAAFWLCPPHGEPLELQARYEDEPDVSGASVDMAAEAILQSRWSQSGPSLELLDSHAAGVIVAPVHSGKEAIGALQWIFARPDPWQGMADQYLVGARRIVIAVEPALQHRFNSGAITWDAAAGQLEQLTTQLHHLQRLIRQTIEKSLRSMAGKSFADFKESQRFVKSIHALLESHGLRVRCPECGHPAILRCSRSSGSAGGGSFVFDHYIDGRRTFHGGGLTVPKVRVTTKPARRSSPAAAS